MSIKKINGGVKFSRKGMRPGVAMFYRSISNPPFSVFAKTRQRNASVGYKMGSFWHHYPLLLGILLLKMVHGS